MKKFNFLTILGLIISFSGVLVMNVIIKSLFILDRITTTFISQMLITLIIIGIIYMERRKDIDFIVDLKINLKIICHAIIYTLIGFIIFPIVFITINFISGSPIIGVAPNMQWGNVPFFIGLIFIQLMTSISEELCFRGYAIERLTRILNNKNLAVIVSIILFLIVHIPLWGMVSIPIGVLGAFWAIIYVKSSNMSLVIVIHFLNNIIAYGFFKR